VPNNGHGIRDLGRVFGSVNALHQHVTQGRRLPKLTWDFAPQAEALRLQVSTDMPAAKMVAWVATAPTRDFREAKWQSAPMRTEGAQQVFELAVPAHGFAALFGEAEYAAEDAPYFFSTNVRIVSAPSPAK
jgi:hypothetical protein